MLVTYPAILNSREARVRVTMTPEEARRLARNLQSLFDSAGVSAETRAMSTEPEAELLRQLGSWIIED